MQTTDRDELTFIGSHFYILQGLRIVPLGCALILWFILESLWPGDVLVRWITAALLISAIPAYILAGLYYSRTFGRVRQKGGNVAFEAATFFGGYLICAFLDGKQDLISFQILFWAFVFMWGYYASSRRRKYFAPVAMFLAVCALLPLTGIVRRDLFFTRSPGTSLGTLVVGIAFVLTGILDHRLLARCLPEPSRASDE